MSGGWRGTIVALGLTALVLVETAGCGVSVHTGTGRTTSVEVDVGDWGPATEGSGVAATETREVGEFHAVEVHYAFQTTIEVGGETGVEITGDDNVLPLVVTEVRDGRLVLRVDGSYSSDLGLHARITTPTLDALELGGSSSARVTGVDADSFELEVGGASEAVLTGRVGALAMAASGSSRAEVAGLAGGSLIAEVSGASHVVLSGAISGAELELSGSSELEVTGLGSGPVAADLNGACTLTVSGVADHLTLEVSGSSSALLGALVVAGAEVELSGAAYAHVHATGTLDGFASGSSTLNYAGSPPTLQVETSGAATLSSK